MKNVDFGSVLIQNGPITNQQPLFENNYATAQRFQIPNDLLSVYSFSLIHQLTHFSPRLDQIYSVMGQTSASLP